MERYLAAGEEPSRPAATMLLAAAMSDTVVLTSPTTTERDRRVAAKLGSLLDLDPEAFGMEMFQASSDVSRLDGKDIVGRDAKEYQLDSGGTALIAQVEVVGRELLERREELQAALEKVRADDGHALAALMVTDIVGKGTVLLVAGDRAGLARAFDADVTDGGIELPGVMSRKKQVVPKVLSAL
jgi:manganese-dependent inorganic pyrophosphatase